MTSSYTVNQGIEKPAAGDQSGTWGGTVNTNMDIIDRVVSGVGALTLTGSTTTLTTTDGTLTDGMYRVLVLGDGGDLGSNNTITISPNDQDKLYLVYNNLTANRSAIFTQGSGDNATVENGETAWIYADGAGSGAAVRVGMSSTKLLDQDGDTGIRVEEGGDDDDTIRFDVAGAEDFTMTANTFTVLSGSTLAVASGATIANSGTATGFGGGGAAYTGVLQTNANFIDQVIFGPTVDGVAWNGAWSKASVFSSLMLATIEDEGSNTEINIWDLTEESAGAISTTPLATVDLSAAATPTAIAASMGYLIVSSEDGIAIIDPHSGAWAERTVGWPRTLSTTTTPALVVAAVAAVAATIDPQAPYDPRTGGKLPTFAVGYGSGTVVASILKDNGTVLDNTALSSYCRTLFASADGRFWAFSNDNKNSTYRPSSTVTADGNFSSNSWTTTDYPGTLAAHSASDGIPNLAVLGGTNGVDFYNTSGVGPTEYDVQRSAFIRATVTRAYNTGYNVGDIRGTWLANSKTVDRSLKGNTLTEAGTVTEGAVESSAELNGYSAWSTSNYLHRASDADWDVLGTGDATISCWMKASTVSGNEQLFGISATDSNPWIGFYHSTTETIYSVIGASANRGFAYPERIDDSKWHQLLMTRFSSADVWYGYLDGASIGQSASGAGSISDSGNMRLAVGIRPSDVTSEPATNSTIALCKISATALTATQVREMYEAEKGMFVASAECLLQSGSTDAVLDVDIDPLTSKVIVTQTDAITIFDGLAIDSKPTVNSGNSEKGKLWGALRAEQNSANAYVTAPATDQRQVNEMVRSLSSDLPAGPDLGTAKAWAIYNSADVAITASYNVKSVVDRGVGQHTVNFGIPFKGGKVHPNTTYVCVGNCEYSSGQAETITFSNADGHTNASAYVFVTDKNGATVDPGLVYVAFFGELENE
jgi:hypothetical protein